MKQIFGSLLLMTVLMLGGCGGDEGENGTPAAAPGTEVPTQTTTVVVPMPEGGGTDTAASAAAPVEAPGTSTAPSASPTP